MLLQPIPLPTPVGIDLIASVVTFELFAALEAQISPLVRKLLSNELLAQLPQSVSLDLTRSPRLDSLRVRIRDMRVLQVYTIDIYHTS